MTRAANVYADLEFMGILIREGQSNITFQRIYSCGMINVRMRCCCMRGYNIIIVSEFPGENDSLPDA